MTKKLLSELIGTFFIVSTVIGSGHMAENLFNDSPGNQLIANTLATGVMLFVLINIFSTYSGAHFNPVVSFCFMLRGDLTIKQFINFSTAQIFGGILGAIIANYMFTDYLFVFSQVERYSDKLFISEIIATFGLVATIFGLIEANKSNTIAASVGLYISGAYWFTSSTSFANPAVTISRVFTDNFTGINPNSILIFIIAQIIGALIAFYFIRFLNKK